MDMATISRARSLGLDVGRIVEGAWADLALVDLQADVLQHVALNRWGRLWCSVSIVRCSSTRV